MCVLRRCEAFKGFWALPGNIYKCVRCHNRFHGNVVKGIWALWDNIYNCACVLYVSRHS